MDEFTLIERLTEVGWKGSRDVVLGPGDDAAVLRGGLVVSTDLAVEQIHFRLDWITPMEVGFRAGAAALSDMAAMGAHPIGLLVSLAVPSADNVAVEIQRGVAAAADRVAVSIVGGDVSRSPGPIVVDVVALGRAKPPVSRGGARVGDDLWLSGSVGAAAFAVREWQEGRLPSEKARRRFVCPPDRTGLGQRLASAGIAQAMIDVSDGVAADSGHVAARSGLRAVIRLEAIPMDSGIPEGLNPALVGGEDYELLFAAEPGLDEEMARVSAELGVPLSRIGYLVKGDGVELKHPDGRTEIFDVGGFDHFSQRSDQR